MAKVFQIIAVLSFLSVSAFAQNTLWKPCPEIKVIGPAGIVLPEDPVKFTASISAEAPKNIRLKWNVTKGRIISGQGTKEILVDQKGAEGASIRATLEISGLPEHCTSAVSDDYTICLPLIPIQIDEYPSETLEAESEKLLMVAGELINNPTNQLYIIEYIPSDTPEEIVNERMEWIRTFLTREGGLDESRITIVVSELEKHMTMIFRVPPGASNPIP